MFKKRKKSAELFVLYKKRNHGHCSSAKNIIGKFIAAFKISEKETQKKTLSDKEKSKTNSTRKKKLVKWEIIGNIR
jgi:hypothetical protein